MYKIIVGDLLPPVPRIENYTLVPTYVPAERVMAGASLLLLLPLLFE
jgi:hypothetical protein